MKTIYTLLVILTFSLSAQATCRMDTLYQYKFAPGSSIKENEYRTIFTYNELGLQVERLQQIWIASSGSFANFKKYSNSFDTDGYILTEIMTVWNTASSAWDNTARTNYYYNAAKKVTTLQYLSWNTATLGWRLQSQLEYTYNAANNVEVYNLWEYNAGADILTNRIRIYHAYDASQNNIERLTQRHDTTTGTLVNYLFVANTFNAANDNVETINQIWEDGDWVNSTRYLKSYTATHRPSETIAQYFGATAWEAYSKTTYTFTSFDSLLLAAQELWDVSVGGWVYSTRILYEYNANRLLTERKIERFSVALSGWRNSDNETYEYNDDDSLVAKDGYSNWLPEGYYSTHYRDEYSCTDIPTSITDATVKSGLKIYPNPVTNQQLSIEVKTAQFYTITDIGGRILQRGELNQGLNTIALKSIVPGFYFVKTGNEVSKIIVR